MAFSVKVSVEADGTLESILLDWSPKEMRERFEISISERHKAVS